MWALALGGMIAAALLTAWRRSGQPAFDFFSLGFTRGIARLYYNIRIRRLAALPPNGPVLLIANHTCSADPAFLQACARRPMSFLIAEEYFKIPLANRLFRYMQSVPVARSGNDMTSVRTALRRLEDGRIVCIFPEGSLSGAGRGRMRTAKRGAAYLALRSGVPVYPAFIFGGPQHTHVPSAWLRPTRGGVIIGRPLDLSAYRDKRIDRKTLEEVGALLVRAIVALDTHAGKPRKPRPPLGENPYDRKRRRARRKALSAGGKGGYTAGGVENMNHENAKERKREKGK
jgi:1-acyl-sn-glycerol-3-phosphate acyltransferase